MAESLLQRYMLASEKYDFISNISSYSNITGTPVGTYYNENGLKLSSVRNSIVTASCYSIANNPSAATTDITSTAYTRDMFFDECVQIGAIYDSISAQNVGLLFYISSEGNAYDLITHTYIGNSAYLIFGDGYGIHTHNVDYKAMRMRS